MSNHLTLPEREVIAQMWYANSSRTEIALKLGRHRGTIGRELNRNSSPRGYSAVAAQERADRRRRERPRRRKMECPHVRRYVCNGLRRYWSPDEIAGRLPVDFPHDEGWRLSHETIYAWIRHEPRWRRYLRRGMPKRRENDRRGRIPAQVSIDGRPAVVERRARYGDWEGDTVVGKQRRGGLVSLVERKSGYLLLGQVDRLQAQPVRQVAAELLRPLPPTLRRTLTLDNGKEFSDHQQLTRRLRIDVYFAHAYCAWERGTNENTNGLVRQFFPKGSDLASLPSDRVERVQDLLNHRPRRRLGYRTPHEVLTTRPRVAIET
jgi:IS30 family transposase